MEIHSATITQVLLSNIGTKFGYFFTTCIEKMHVITGTFVNTVSILFTTISKLH